MKKLLALSLCILMFAFCACQKTPDEEYIINKGDNTAEEKINATPLPTSAVGTAPVGTEPADTENTEVDHGFENAAYQPVFPEHWDDSIKTDYKEIIINADITTSGQLSYPVHLVKRHAETTEERNRLGNILFPEISGWYTGDETKEYYMACMAKLAELDIPEETREAQLEVLLLSLGSTITTEADVIPAAHFEEIDAESFKYGAVKIILPDGTYSFVSMYKNSVVYNKHITTGIQTQKALDANGGGGFEEEKGFVIRPELSLEEAERSANELFKAFGIEGFDLVNSEKARSINGCSLEIYSMGWQLRFVRTFGYVPVDTRSDSSSYPFSFEDEEYGEPWKQEFIELYVSGSGVERIEWGNRLDDLETVNENVQLMAFEELEPIIKRIMTAGISSPNQSEGYFVVEEIILTVIPQQKKGSNDAYLMPVWLLKLGCYVSIGDGLGVSHFYIPGEQLFEGWTYVGFNAIDGTRVKVLQG